MATREEIREGIAKVLYTFEYDGWDKLSEGDRVRWLTRADAVMNKLHSQGVVIKVEDGYHATIDGRKLVAVEPLIGGSD